MKTCLCCKATFKTWVKVDGIDRNLASRKYCLTCSPFGSKNRKLLHVIYEPRPIYRISSRDYGGLSPEQKKEYNTFRHNAIKAARTETKRKLVNLAGGKCIKCGYGKNLAALIFHHRDPTKKDFNISAAGKCPFEQLVEETKKCDLLCCRCHAECHHPDLECVVLDGQADGFQSVV